MGTIGAWAWGLSTTYRRDDIGVGVTDSANYSLSYHAPALVTQRNMHKLCASRADATRKAARTLARRFAADQNLASCPLHHVVVP